MKWKLWLNLATFIALGLIVYFAWGDINEVFYSLGRLNPWALALMVPVQFFVFYATAKMFGHFLSSLSARVPFKTMLPAVMELNFVNHVFPSGGVSGFSYFALRLKMLGVSTAKSTLAQVARFAFVLVGFIGLMILALIMLAVEDHASSLMILIVSSLTSIIIFVSLVIAYVISRESRIGTFSRVLAKNLNKFIKLFRRSKPGPIKEELVEATFLELHRDYLLVKKDRQMLKRVIIWATVLNLAEIALVYLAFIAHGEFINPGAVIVAFVIANVAGLIAFLPGGLGVFEPLMTAVLISAGVSPALALGATLVYRVIALVLSLVFGYVSYQFVIHKYGKAGT